MFYTLIIILSITILYFIIENSYSPIYSTGHLSNTIPLQFKIEPKDNHLSFSKIESDNSKDKNQDFKIVQFRRVNNRIVVDEKLKKYKQQLRRVLRTLEYISLMETNTKLKRTLKQKKELDDLKANVQHQVLRLSKQIKEYKSYQIKVEAA